MLIIGCGLTPNPSGINPNLPTINNIKTLSDVNEIGLEWTPITSSMIKGYHVYRSNPKSNSNKLEHIATIKDRYTSHYLDKNLMPNQIYYYRMSSYSNSYTESNPGDMVEVSTKPKLEAVPFTQAISGLPKRVKIIWRPHPSISVQSYVVEQRKFDGEDSWKRVCEVKGRLSAECIDKNLEDGKSYQYRVIARTNGGLYSQASDVMVAKTKSIPPEVSNLSASVDQPKKIILSWDGSKNQDVVYYNIYSSPTSFLLFTKLASTKNVGYEDLIDTNGKTKYYKVTAVDNDGLESIKQDLPVKGKSLDAPPRPVLVSAVQNGSSILLQWVSDSENIQKFYLFKSFNGSTTRIVNIQSAIYEDTDVQAGVEYEYRVVGVDGFGLQSDKSNKIKIKFGK